MAANLDDVCQLLDDAGIPYKGVTWQNGTTTVQYKNAATAEQRAAGDAIIAANPIVQRKKRRLADIRADVAALSNADRNKAINHLLAVWLRDNPDQMRRLNIPVDGDEVDNG